jgi:mono/diheme cytochrome c family protein
MQRRVFLFVIVAAMSAAFALAQDSKLTISPKPTQVTDGKQMFESYCAACHGLDGRGNGPTAGALKVAPANLAQLSKNNKGVYPETRIVAVLKFGTENPAHGSKAMPVWGPTLRTMDGRQGGDEKQLLRISNLVKYVATLQAK